MRLLSRLFVVQYDSLVTRADAIENRERLIAVTGQLLDELAEVSLIDLARVTGLGRATVYRHFSSTEAVVEAYVLEQLAPFLAAGAEPIGEGEALVRIRLLCASWGELVARAGSALVHVRSTRGFLERAAAGDPIISPIFEVVHGVFEALARDGALVAVDAMTATFHWNLLFDPRDVLDLAAAREADVTETVDSLTDDLLRLLAVG